MSFREERRPCFLVSRVLLQVVNTDWKHSVTEPGDTKKHGRRSSRDDTATSIKLVHFKMSTSPER